MKISTEKLEAIMAKNPKDWVDVADNIHGMVYWNKVTGAIIWMSWRDEDNTYTEPKIKPQR